MNMHEEVTKAAVRELTATAEENHRSKMAHLIGEVNKALDVQAKGYAAAATKLTQEAKAGREEIANYVVAKETAETRYQEQWVAASDTIADRDCDSKDEEVRRLSGRLNTAQTSIAQNQAEHIGKIAHANKRGVPHLAPTQ